MRRLVSAASSLLGLGFPLGFFWPMSMAQAPSSTVGRMTSREWTEGRLGRSRRADPVAQHLVADIEIRREDVFRRVVDDNKSEQ